MTDYDLLIIGGGINGTGIARDAAGRGLKTLLVEMNDLASATSSKSTKLIHGGLRYLEYFEFLLVRKALNEREVLLANAPHIIKPMKFILPHEKHLRPKWMIRLGLFLYDHLGMRKTLGKSRAVKLSPDDPANPLYEQFHDAFSYYDCWVDDARLVVLNAMDAAEKGAEIKTRTKFVSATNENGIWTTEIEDCLTGKKQTVTTKVLINAAGPWVSDIINDGLSLPAHNRLRLVKGSHIITPKLFDGEDAFILQNKDGRIIFAIPYEEDYTLIGTTDVPYEGDPSEVEISDDEITYLCDHINQYFRPTLPHGNKLSPSDVISHYAGVRPLYDDASQEASAVTRDYVLALRQDDSSGNDGGAPLLSIFGGKITTFRHLAEQALEKLEPFFPDITQKAGWTETSPLPGGDIAEQDLAKFTAQQQRKYPWLDPSLCARYARSYGSRMNIMLAPIKPDGNSGNLIGPDLYEYEAKYLMTYEWARSSEDILWRRTKLGLQWTAKDIQNLDNWIAENQ